MADQRPLIMTHLLMDDLMQESLVGLMKNPKIQQIDWETSEGDIARFIPVAGDVVFSHKEGEYFPPIDLGGEFLKEGGDLTSKMIEKFQEKVLSGELEATVQKSAGPHPRYNLKEIGKVVEGKPALEPFWGGGVNGQFSYNADTEEVRTESLPVQESRYAVETFVQALTDFPEQRENGRYIWSGYMILFDEHKKWEGDSTTARWDRETGEWTTEHTEINDHPHRYMPYIVVERVMGPGIPTLEEWEKANVESHEQVMQEMRLLVFPQPPTTGFDLPSGEQVVYLKDFDALYDETETMHHGVVQWVHSCVAGNSFIYSVRKDGQSIATLEVGLDTQMRHIVGPDNSKVSQELIEELESAFEEVLERKRIGSLESDPMKHERTL